MKFVIIAVQEVSLLVDGDVSLAAFFFLEVAVGDDGEWRRLLKMASDELQVEEESLLCRLGRVEVQTVWVDVVCLVVENLIS